MIYGPVNTNKDEDVGLTPMADEKDISMGENENKDEGLISISTTHSVLEPMEEKDSYRKYNIEGLMEVENQNVNLVDEMSCPPIFGDETIFPPNINNPKDHGFDFDNLNDNKIKEDSLLDVQGGQDEVTLDNTLEFLNRAKLKVDTSLGVYT